MMYKYSEYVMDSKKPKFTDIVKAAQEAERNTWKDFTASTTFHGVKYIFNPNTSGFRR